MIQGNEIDDILSLFISTFLAVTDRKKTSIRGILAFGAIPLMGIKTSLLIGG